MVEARRSQNGERYVHNHCIALFCFCWRKSESHVTLFFSIGKDEGENEQATAQQNSHEDRPFSEERTDELSFPLDEQMVWRRYKALCQGQEVRGCSLLSLFASSRAHRRKYESECSAVNAGHTTILEEQDTVPNNLASNSHP